MSLRDIVFGAMLGATAASAVAVTVGLRFPSADPEPPPPEPIVEGAGQAAPLSPRPVPIAVPAGTSEDALEAEARLEALEQENAWLREQLRQLGALDVPFPEDLPDVFREAALHRSLDGLDPELEGIAERLEVDCSEFPCVVVYQLAEGVPVSSETVDPVLHGLTEVAAAEGRDVKRHTSITQTEQGASLVLLSVYPPEHADPAVEERLRARMRDLAADVELTD